MKPVFFFAIAVLVAFLLDASAYAQGGPPLLTDDPDPVAAGDGHWEINVAATLQAASDGVQAYELPHIDLNYGLGDSIQLKWESGIAALGQNGRGLRAGWEDSLFGVKWRIKNSGEEGFSFGVYPQIGTRLLSSNDPDLAGPSTYAILPVEVKYGMGELALDAEIGALLYANAGSGWMYGFCAGYNATKLVEIIAELHGTIGNSLIFPPGLIAQVGTRIGFNATIALIASVGTTIIVPLEAPTTLLFFAGIRLTL